MEARGSATAVVLAGGRSQRMGEPKAALLIGGEPLLRRVTNRLRMALPAVVIIGPPELSALVPEVPVLPDLHPGLGPLAGLEAALQAITSELAFVVACDMPFILPALVEAMVAYARAYPEADVVTLARSGPCMGDIAKSTGIETRMEHLHAVYRAGCLPAISRQIAAGRYALHEFFALLHVDVFPYDVALRLDPRGLSSYNVNTPQDWAQAQQLAAAQEP